MRHGWKWGGGFSNDNHKQVSICLTSWMPLRNWHFVEDPRHKDTSDNYMVSDLAVRR